MAVPEDAGKGHRVCVGRIAGAHGVRGWVRVESYTADPAAIGSYGPLSDESGKRQLTLTVKRMAKGSAIAAIEGVTDRNAAEALAGLRLFVDRDALPPVADDEFYRADLIGLEAVLTDGSPLGRVIAVEDFGAGDVLEVARPGQPSVLVPFTAAVVPEVDIAGGRLVIDPPPGLLEPVRDDEDAADQRGGRS